MRKNRESFLAKFLLDIVMIGFSLFRVVPKLVTLLEEEMKTASRSLFSLIMFFLIVGALILSTWFSVLAFFVVLLISLQFTLLSSLAIVIGSNILLLIFMMFIIKRTKRHLTFSRTRCLIRHLRQS